MGQSTAAKRLAALEGAGAVRRHPGGRVNGTRVADRWSVPAVPVGGDNAATAETAAPEPAEPSAAGERLGRGALGTLVRDYLAARPDEDLGPDPGGQGAGRSQGAVSNALSRLEAAGEARLVSVTPRRYRIVSDR